MSHEPGDAAQHVVEQGYESSAEAWESGYLAAISDMIETLRKSKDDAKRLKGITVWRRAMQWADQKLMCNGLGVFGGPRTEDLLELSDEDLAVLAGEFFSASVSYQVQLRAARVLANRRKAR